MKELIEEYLLTVLEVFISMIFIQSIYKIFEIISS